MATSAGGTDSHRRLLVRHPLAVVFLLAACTAGWAEPGPRAAPLDKSRSRLTSPSTRVSDSSYMDVRRGMSRGTNHSTREVTRATERDQKAQAGHPKASAITRSTGLRRRERRFESCRGHHL